MARSKSSARVLLVAAILLISLVAYTEAACKWACPKGKKAIANPRHVPSFNGCGNSMIQVLSSEEWDFTPCCNAHDICFDTCGSEKEDCDEQFGECMQELCVDVKPGMKQACQSQAQMYLLGGSMFGCDSYKKSQRAACRCVANDEL